MLEAFKLCGVWYDILFPKHTILVRLWKKVWSLITWGPWNNNNEKTHDFQTFKCWARWIATNITIPTNENGWKRSNHWINPSYHAIIKHFKSSNPYKDEDVGCKNIFWIFGFKCSQKVLVLISILSQEGIMGFEPTQIH
jgi:hypothetical protein